MILEPNFDFLCKKNRHHFKNLIRTWVRRELSAYLFIWVEWFFAFVQHDFGSNIASLTIIKWRIQRRFICFFGAHEMFFKLMYCLLFLYSEDLFYWKKKKGVMNSNFGTWQFVPRWVMLHMGRVCNGVEGHMRHLFLPNHQQRNLGEGFQRMSVDLWWKLI